MVTVPYRWIVMDQMQDGWPAANALTVDSQHTGNGFIQKPLFNHKIILFPKTSRTEGLAATSPTFQFSLFLISRPHGVCVPMGNTTSTDIDQRSVSSVTILKNHDSDADL
jgi:hypothetical protein